MKRLIIGALASLALVLGSFAFVTPQASAACPYTGCYDTRTYIKAPKRIKANKPFKVNCRVRVLGDTKAIGAIKSKIKGEIGKGKNKKIVYIVKKAKLTSSQKHTFRFDGLRPGKYRVYCTYKKKPNSPYRPSGVNKKLVVKKAAKG